MGRITFVKSYGVVSEDAIENVRREGLQPTGNTIYEPTSELKEQD